MIDALQILLSFPVGIALLMFPAMVGVYFSFRLLSEGLKGCVGAYKFIRSLFPRFGARFFLLWACFSLSAWSFRHQVTDAAVFVSQSILNPVYYSTFNADTSSAVEQAYIKKLRQNVSQREFDILMTTTADLARRHQSSVLAFLEVYESECGLNPFAVNVNEKGDTVAAGQIQFTWAGVSGLQVSGMPVNMRRVKNAIIHRDIVFLCELERVYMERAAAGKPLKRSCDVYTAVFMPYYLGMPDMTVVASRNGNRPEFYNCNAGLDCYKLAGDKVLRSPKYQNGEITIQDLSLCLAYKKAGVIKQYKA